MMSSSSDELLRNGADLAIEVRNLRVVRGKRVALDDVSVQIARGTITGLLGPSGCGKTTLMRSIVGTQIIAHGTVTVLGLPAGSADLRHRVGYVTQNPTIYDDLRVIDNVRYFASLYGADAAAADDATAAVGLDDHRTALCGNLSGGQRTRASLACALVSRPDLLVLDEPTVGLDPVLRVDLWDQFHQLAQNGTTLLVSSHVMDEADHCGDLLLMRDGHLLAHTTPAKLREDTGCQSLEEAFLSVIRHSTAPETSRPAPAGLSGHHHANPAPTRGRPPQRRDDPRRADLIITLMYFMFQNAPHHPGTPSPFNNACLIMLGVFPLIVMFLITSITMQRERVSGTLERILTTPLRRWTCLPPTDGVLDRRRRAGDFGLLVSFWFSAWTPQAVRFWCSPSRSSTRCSGSGWACCAVHSPARSFKRCSSCRW